jgi:hypothetical protein
MTIVVVFSAAKLMISGGNRASEIGLSAYIFRSIVKKQEKVWIVQLFFVYLQSKLNINILITFIV